MKRCVIKPVNNDKRNYSKERYKPNTIQWTPCRGPKKILTLIQGPWMAKPCLVHTLVANQPKVLEKKIHKLSMGPQTPIILMLDVAFGVFNNRQD